MPPGPWQPISAGVVILAGVLAGCTQPQAADLCAAITAGDVAAAEKALAGGEADMLRQQGRCHPAFDVLTSLDVDGGTRHEMLRAMLKAGLDPNASLSRSGAGRSGGRSTTTTRGLIEWATADPVAVEILISAGLDVQAPPAGLAVAQAAGEGTLDVVRRLIEAGAPVDEPLRARDDSPTTVTALGRAIAERHHDVIAYLESKGARPSAGPSSPLFDAARKGDVSGVRAAVAAGADVNAVDEHGQSPLLRAAGFGQTAGVDALIAAKADVNAFFNGESALQAAATEGHADVIRVLAKAGAQVNGRVDDQDRPALLRAAEGRRHDAVAALVAAGADVNAADGGGTTPLAVAVRMRDARLAQALLPGRPKLGAVDASTGLPVLHSTVTGCEAQDFDVPLLRALVAAGVDVRAKDTEGRTARQKAEASLQGETRPFYKACYEARVAALKALGG